MQDPDRRHLIKAAAILAVAAPLAAQAEAPTAGPASAFTPKPLPFDPKSIAGLSEKLLISHHDNNYVGAVTRLGTIGKQLAAIDPATAPGFQLNGLKREELLAWNSMILHEIYFSASARRPARAPLWPRPSSGTSAATRAGGRSSLASARRLAAGRDGWCSSTATTSTA